MKLRERDIRVGVFVDVTLGEAPMAVCEAVSLEDASEGEEVGLGVSVGSEDELDDSVEVSV